MFKRKPKRPIEDWPEWPTMKNGKAPKDMHVEVLPNGMKVLDRRHFAPIHMWPGDTLQCIYEQSWMDEGGVVHQKKSILAAHRVTEPSIVDTAIIVELDDGTLDALALKSGVAGIFGESK